MRRRLSSWVVGLGLAVAAASGLTVFAQSQSLRGPVPRILTGNDIGFRIDGRDPRGRVVGTWMVRVGGEWVEAGAAPVVRPLK